MTKPNLTSINIILDRSGSMTRLANDTIGGFNTFISEQKKLDGEAVLTLATFSSNYTLVHDCKPLKSIQDLTLTTYQPAGYTALLDAIGRTINSTGAKLAAMPEEERPSKVIFVIMTDGEENASTEFTHEKIKEMISHQSATYSWEFVYLGAGIDAFVAGTAIGISASNTLSYSADAATTRSTFDLISNNMSTYRKSDQARVDFFDQKIVVTGNPVTISGVGPKSNN